MGKSSRSDDIIGMFGEGKCNVSGNWLIFVVCNGREFTVEPQWTRTRSFLRQKSLI